jgi:ribonuclease J
MYRASKRSGRTFLQELYMAEITSSIGGSIPNPNFSDVYAFITNSNRYDELKKYKHKMGKQQISKIPFVMCVRTSMLEYMESLSELMSFENGVLVYSFWSGYKENEEMKTFLSACENLGLEIVTLHTSGHADYESIRQLVKRVNPNEIIPIHTESPEKMTFVF